MKKKILFRLAAVIIGFLAPLLVTEIVLRFLPVYGGLKFAPLNAANPVPHFTPNQSVQWSRGWNFQLANKIRINNYGFVNDQDYDPAATTPLLAVVGDSYIEAAMVPYAETLQGRLQERVGARGRVYSFAKSGTGLSTYLIWVEHARRTFKADGLVISIVGNDFKESLNKYKPTPSGYYYVESANGELQLKRFDYQPTSLRIWTRKLALFRYLIWNCEVEGALMRLRHRDDEFVGNVGARKDGQEVRDCQKGVDAFLRDLPGKAGLSPDRILFIVDGMRPHLYDPQTLAKAKGSFVDVMREYFLEQARHQGYEVIDLQPVFIEDFQKNGRPFEYPTDAHWSGVGHGVVAGAVMKSKVFNQILGNTVSIQNRDARPASSTAARAY